MAASIEEREGLLPVLARQRFWELNGVYPVYFVWETGLLETLRDIVSLGDVAREVRGGLARRRHRGARAPRRQTGLGPDEAERRKRRPANGGARGWWPN